MRRIIVNMAMSVFGTKEAEVIKVPTKHGPGNELPDLGTFRGPVGLPQGGQTKRPTIYRLPCLVLLPADSGGPSKF